MSSREQIDLINIILNGLVEKEKKGKGFLTREFFDSEELRNSIRGSLDVMYSIQGLPIMSDEKFERFFNISVKDIRYKHKHSMTPSISLTAKNNRKLWLTDEYIKNIGWTNDEITTYRARYIEYLKKLGRSSSYIDETKRSSLEIVKKLGNPHSEGEYFKRGLVVGSVQSGKTANFNAVINSALDVGYDLIIVLSGIMEDLRIQTQKRIEKEVVGKFVNGKFIGVGDPHSFGTMGKHKNVNQVYIPTSAKTDFKKNMKEADFDLNHKNILVCKKNTGVLKNLILWLNDYLNENKDKIEIPFLIVDDEADNASLNNLGHKGKEYASTINGHIRALLALFKKKTYLGYTATPFGNVLQDRNIKPDNKWKIVDKSEEKEFEQEASLFPHDFIELLFPPSNYVGAKHFFETRYKEVKKIEPLIPMVVNDYNNAFPSRLDEDGYPTFSTDKGSRAAKKEDVFPASKKDLPESLKDAIKCFIISTAIRISREKEMFQSKMFQPHNTMLIHISRFTTWQTRTKKFVEEYVNELSSSLNNDSPSDENGIYAEFELVWNKFYAYAIENIRNYLDDEYEDDFLKGRTFKEISPLLIKSISDVEVKAINSETKDNLVYEDDTPKKYIAIGGNRLSRGFTLEGLTINYFIRNTNFADTLLQMGRWFGYRPGYIDCCKLFTTQDTLDKFDQTTATIEDLEQKFIDMNKDPDNTPDKYALRVLKHPGVLKITRPNILKNTKEVNWSYSDHLIQTTKFEIDSDRMKRSWESFKSYVSSRKSMFEIKKDEKGKPEYLEYQTQNINDLFALLKLSNCFFDKSLKSESDYFKELEEYIKLCNKNNKLTNWSIVIKVSGRGNEISADKSKLPINIKSTVRSGFKPDTRFFNLLNSEKVFAAGGASSNILGGAKDMQIRLSESQILNATKNFKDDLLIEYKEKFKDLSLEEIQEKVRKVSPPEKVFRRMMSEEEGVVVIYLMDTESIFKYKGENIDELNTLKKSIDTEIPLIGYAIGIPDIDPNIGGNYLQSVFHEDEENEECYDFEELREELENE